MALKHPENFVTYGNRTLNRGIAQSNLTQIEKALELARTPASTSNLRARRTAAQLQTLLEEADAEFQAQRYQSALDGYGRVSQKVLSLMKPDAGWHILPVEWPSGPDMVRILNHTATDLLSQMAPEQQEVPSVVLDERVDVDELETGTSRPMVIHAGRTAADRILDRAGAAVEQGRWSEAASLYERSLQIVTDESRKADILLNLGAVEVQMKRPQEAMRHLQEAQSTYEELGDTLGAAQAVHNSGLGQLSTGDGGSAVTTLNRARELAGKASLIGFLQPGSGGSSDDGNGRGGGRDDSGGRPILPDPPRGPTHPPGGGIPFEPPGGGPVLHFNQPGGAAPLGNEPQFEANRLAESLGSHDLTLRLRPVRKGSVLPDIQLETPIQEQQESFERTLVLPAAGESVELTWSKNRRLQPDMLEDVLRRRLDIDVLDEIKVDLDTPAGILSNLSHLYHLVLPVRMGDCHHQLGNHRRAENEYRRAAEYEMTNRSLEGADLWRRLAENALAWGDALYRKGDAIAAASVYERLTTPEGEVPDSFLYRLASLKQTGDRVRAWLESVAAEEEPPKLNPVIAQTLQTVHRRWSFLSAGLDFFGGQATVVPPFTFRHLQDVSRYFAQRAIQAEQRYIDFYNRFEQGEMTRRQLENAAEQAALDAEVAREREKAAQKTVNAADASVALADTRHQNANDMLGKFNDTAWELEALSGHIARGNAFHGSDQPNLNYSAGGRYHFDDERHVVLQQLTRRKTRLSNDLQRKRMQNSVSEANAAREVAQRQRQVAQAQREAARAERQAAEQRAEHATEMRDAFEEQKFTPEQWLSMAKLMSQLAGKALERGIETARLMQQAYNFEHLDDRQSIRDNYELGSTGGMLGGEMLLSDIDGFTAYLVSEVRHKPIPVKWTISLSEEYPGHFLQFANTGRMEFDIDSERLRLRHPGTYRHQLKGIEVEADGFLPPFGLSGRLTNTGIGYFRDEAGEKKTRIQPAETMILSQYDRRQDALILSPPREMRALFEGNAATSGWTLEIPPSANDVDLQAIFDIRLVLYFECLYDSGLFEQDTQPREDIEFERSRAFYLRQHFPDAYFELREHGQASIELTPADFPYNQMQPVLQSLALALVPGAEPDAQASLNGTRLRVDYPGGSGGSQATVGETLAVPADDLPVDGESPSALGRYMIEFDEDQAERKDLIDDIVLLMEYQFTPADQ